MISNNWTLKPNEIDTFIRRLERTIDSQMEIRRQTEEYNPLVDSLIRHWLSVVKIGLKQIAFWMDRRI